MICFGNQVLFKPNKPMLLGLMGKMGLIFFGRGTDGRRPQMEKKAMILVIGVLWSLKKMEVFRKWVFKTHLISLLM